jgi:putative ABC transport system ATP-binding protein
MQTLAKEQGTSILLVTHDNRILDIADRILEMEDGHLARNSQSTSIMMNQKLNIITPNS